MPETYELLVQRVQGALRAVLPKSALGEVESVPDSQSNFVARVSGNLLSVTWVRHAWLSTINDLLAREDPPDLLVGDRIPPASRSALIERGIGWVETSGAAEIETDFLVVSRSSQRRRFDKTKSRWTPAALGVAEAILMEVKPTVSATHEATGLSVGACTKALRMFTEVGLLEAEARRGRHAGRHLSEPDAMLDAYVEAAHDLQPSLMLSAGASWRDPVEGLIEIGRRWDRGGVSWVATGLVAASVVAPLVTSVGTAEAYVAGDSMLELELAASMAGLRPIEGGRLILSPYPTETTRHMAASVDGLRVAPWPRLVADLRRSGVRGEEAAEHVREILGGG